MVALRIADWAHLHYSTPLLAVMLDTTLAASAGSIQSLMANDGVTGVPIGLSHTTNVPTGSGPYQADLRTRGISAGYITGSETYADSLTIYRTLLAAAVGAIDIISIGYLNNLSDLLQSPADGISPLTGLQLVTAKVRHLWIMGGQYPSGSEHNFNNTPVGIAGANYVVANWPTPITYLGFEVGSSVLSGATVSGLQPGDLLAQAMSDYGSFARSSWDPMNTMMAILSTPLQAGYTEVFGSNSVDIVTGANTFTPNVNGRDSYVVKANPDSWFVNWLNFHILKTNW